MNILFSHDCVVHICFRLSLKKQVMRVALQLQSQSKDLGPELMTVAAV